MADRDKYASIADSSRPNAGRIYDFILGGTHNFEVDRIAAQQVLTMIPFMPQLFRLIRWFLGEAVRRLTADGYTQYIDFASGLPTVDHIHQIAPANAKVIYSDIDPVTVAYGQEILKDTPNARYIVCPAEKPEELLGSSVVTELLGANRKVAFGFNGIAYFVQDDHLRHSMKVLHDWAAKGSRLFLCDVGYETSTVPAAGQEVMNLYKSIGQSIYFRSLETLKKLVQPWKATEPGYRPLEEWIGVTAGITDRSKVEGFNMMGVILEK